MPLIMNRMSLLVSCVKVGSKSYLRGDFLVDCSMPLVAEYRKYIVILIAVFIVALPALMLYRINQRKKIVNSILVQLQYGILIYEYNDRSFYWEFVKIYLRSKHDE